MKLLLLSNSRDADGGYLTHAVSRIAALTKGCRQAIFVHYAGVTQTWDAYTDTVRTALADTGLTIVGAHTIAARPLADDECVIVGGGNTFALLKETRASGWLAAIQSGVRAGAPYIGWSAGSNLSCPTICTTNDMPIVDPQGFEALGLIDFQINPHYTNALPAGHRGETRDQRLAEYHVANPQSVVVALPEGDWIAVEGTTITSHGPHAGWLLRQGIAPVALKDGDCIA